MIMDKKIRDEWEKGRKAREEDLAFQYKQRRITEGQIARKSIIGFIKWRRGFKRSFSEYLNIEAVDFPPMKISALKNNEDIPDKLKKIFK